MNRTEKADLVAEIKDELGKAASLVLADYRGLTVEEVNGIRKEFRQANCHYRVLKNKLVKRAIAGTPMEVISPLLKGPTVFCLLARGSLCTRKILDKFSSSLEKLELKGAVLEGRALDQKGVKELAKMKSKDELRAELLALFNAPAQGLCGSWLPGPRNLFICSMLGNGH